MSQATFKLDSIEWVKVPYIKTSEEGPVENHTFAYELWLPSFLASWDVWSYWERERIEHMQANLTRGDILFDIGTEVGWMSVIQANMVGPENMVLIEPTPEFWANIKATWVRNGLPPPLACYAGLLGDKEHSTGEDVFSKGWLPKIGDELIDKMAYRYVHNNLDHERKDPVPETTIDTLVKQHGIVPTALTMDVEGAEYIILKGAENTLRKHDLKVWVSVHPDLGIRDYGATPDDVHNLMSSLGYKAEHLATDHEVHMYYHKVGKAKKGRK